MPDSGKTPFKVSLPRTAQVGLSMVMLCGVILLDYFTGLEMPFAIFYLIPIAYAGWFLGRTAGLVISLLSFTGWFGVDYISVHQYSIFLVVAGSCMFFLTALMASRLSISLTTEREARAVAEISTRAKTEFLSNMSHEIRTPMNSILGTADLLMETKLSAEQKEYVRLFQAEGAQLLKLINNLLDISKIESGKLEMEHAFFNIHRMIAELLSIMASRAKDKGLQLKYVVSPDIEPEIYGSHDLLRRVLYNLVGNAVKFTENGLVTLNVEWKSLRDETLLFTISDTGIGISADKLDVIFERFTQADASTTRKYGGTGLGLSLSRKIVEMMGGRIWVESVPGQGSTFYFTLPVKCPKDVNVPPAPRPVAAAPALLTADTRPLRILIVEDYDANRAITRAFLRKTAYTIDEAENGKIGLEKYKLTRFDVILMDVQMPVMDGYQATRAIRSYETEKKLSPAPIIALTAYAYEKDSDVCLTAGCTTRLTKPYSKADLLNAIRSVT
ncbi:MAG: ATP-binding protein [Fibrobacterota bacterium]